jgi:pectate lyase
VVQKEPLWIVFERNMKIKLKKELLMKSYKTLDGRGANVHISGGACIAVRYASNIIIHGLHIHDCKPKAYDGDGVGIVGGKNVWVDHNSFANCQDGLVDVTRGSTAVTISNNYFTRHNKVMLLGHSDSFTADKKMQVTVAFNRFGKNLGQRMPRYLPFLSHSIHLIINLIMHASINATDRIMCASLMCEEYINYTRHLRT